MTWVLARLAPFLTLVLLIGSTSVGLLFVGLMAIGYLPGVGVAEPGAEAFRQLLADARLWSAVGATLSAGLAATVTATVTAFILAARASLRDVASAARRQRVAATFLAVPHAALALGLAFLLAPTGWLVRLLATAIGLETPAGVEIVPAEQGLLLALGLYLKETPFLFLAMMAAQGHLAPQRQMLVAGAMGYSAPMAWIKIVLPQLYPLVRFPILAVLAYSLSVVDMSLLLGPTTPPTLPVLILQWNNDPDFDRRFVAAAAGLLQLGLVAATILLWLAAERLVQHCLRHWLSKGRRHVPPTLVGLLGPLMRVWGWLCLGLGLLSLLSLPVWSVAFVWRFPALLPQRFSLAFWRRALGEIGTPLVTSLGLALCVTAAALILAVACLEHERRLTREIVAAAERWLYLPLLVPEISFLVGLQVFLLVIGLNGTWAAVAWLQLLFVFPYVFLSLKEPWRALDPRFERIGLALGVSPSRVFWRIKLPLLKRALAWSAAIGCAVSLSLYLPTIQGGEGRITTLATEAVALGSGGDRRLAGIYGSLQAIATGLCLICALLVARPRWGSVK